MYYDYLELNFVYYYYYIIFIIIFVKIAIFLIFFHVFILSDFFQVDGSNEKKIPKVLIKLTKNESIYF